MIKYEYTTRTNLAEHQMNHLGSLGWELVAVLQNSFDYKFYFKRPVKTEVRPIDTLTDLIFAP